MNEDSLENVMADGATDLNPEQMKLKLEDSIYSPTDLQRKLTEIKQEGLESSR